MDSEENALVQLERALEQTGRVVSGVRTEQLALPTPCADWNVQMVLSHIVFGLQREARLVRGGPIDRGEGTGFVTDDWQSVYSAAREDLLSAWRSTGALEATYPWPFSNAPAPLVISMRTVEVIVHGWDLAKATGQTDKLDLRLGELALSLAGLLMPANRSGSPFGPIVPVPDSAGVYDRLAGFVGRQP